MRSADQPHIKSENLFMERTEIVSSNCQDSQVFYHMKFVILLQIVIGTCQLVVALIGSIIVTQVRPWKKLKVIFLNIFAA